MAHAPSNAEPVGPKDKAPTGLPPGPCLHMGGDWGPPTHTDPVYPIPSGQLRQRLEPYPDGP